VETEATNYIFFEVIAEDGVTKITYQLQLDVTDSEAYVFSDVFEVDQDLQMISLVPGGIRVEEFFKHLTTNEGATIGLYDKSGLKIEQGDVYYDDMVIVTSPDGTTDKVYSLGFLEEPVGFDAYVLSDVFTVDQLGREISEIQPGLNIDIFYGLLTPASGATMTLLDSEGNEKTSGEVTNDDQLQVVSGNGLITVTYDLILLSTGIDPNRNQTGFTVYPNPAKDLIFVEGVSGNSKIVIRNILGEVVKMVDSKHIQNGSISVSGMSKGIYFIYLQTENDRSDPVKLLIH